MRIRPTYLFLILSLIAVGAPALEARQLSVEERVAAQRAIEEVLWNHRIWPQENGTPKPTLSMVMPDEAIRAKVDAYLKKSNALAGQLQAEMDRMAANTRDPQVLQELFDALGNDPFVIAETLVRQTLADRERAYDRTRVSDTSGRFVLAPLGGGACVDDTWLATSTAPGVPAARMSHAAIWSGAELIVWGGFAQGIGYTNTGGRYTPATDSWAATSTGPSVPSGRRTPGVWTGTEMIVWGGYDGSGVPLDTGGRYNPATNTWATTLIGANLPPARSEHTSVWTGTEMIVWGGRNSSNTALSSGGRYAPSTDTWTATSGVGVPEARSDHAAVWTGTEMIVWGGLSNTFLSLNTGGRYNPSTDVWTATSTGTNVPAGRAYLPAVWTGTEMIVWGGGGAALQQSGGRYNPTSNTWLATSTGANVPSARRSHIAVWTGTEMIVWGGFPLTNTGGRYSSSTNAWVATLTGANVPSARSLHAAAWTGAEMIVWGGGDESGVVLHNTGGRYCACPNGQLAYRDADGDGSGNPALLTATCDGSIPTGYVADNTDCNDANPAVYTGAPEICNGADDNCGGGADEGLPTVTWFPDVDGDRYGNSAPTVEACFPPPSHVRNGLDCDDTDPSVLPGGIETCDGKRNDCGGAGWPALLDDDLDEIENACETCTDGDGDGWGDPGVPGNTCAPDNCSLIANPGQADVDFDGQGDACDACPNDPLDDEDGDALCGDVDNCPKDPNPGQQNTDGDPYGDDCDPCPLVAGGGSGGGECSPDTDGDGIPNAADPDDDQDGVPDEDGDAISDPCTGGNRFDCDDNCVFDFNVLQRDRDGDGIGDLCDRADDLVQGGSASKTETGSGLLGTTVAYEFAWEPESGALGYNVYRGLLSGLPAGSYGGCYRNRIVTSFTWLPESPVTGSGFFYLVTPVYAEREGSLGVRSDGTERPLSLACP